MKSILESELSSMTLNLGIRVHMRQNLKQEHELRLHSRIAFSVIGALFDDPTD